jgi:hypothetical protein
MPDGSLKKRSVPAEKKVRAKSLPDGPVQNMGHTS